MFGKVNVGWILPTFINFFIVFAVLVAMAIEAHMIRKKLNDELYSHIVRGLQRIGSQGQTFARSVYE